MYKVCADINDVEYRPVLLDDQYQITADKLLAATDDHTKIIWLCTPNNPTGNCLNRDEVVKVIEQFEGLVIVDEAYIEQFEGLVIVDEAYSDFASQRSLRFDLANYPNLIVLNTMSKAWGCAAIRLGMAFASKEIIELFNKMQAFTELPICEKVYPTEANFFLAKMSDATRIYNYLVDQGIIVRNRTRVQLCQNCLRITIGTKSENSELIAALRQYQ